MKQAITEEAGLHKGWFAEARKQTVETLPEFIRHLTEDYEHDYGTICHAITAAALAVASAVNHHPCGGITGFQAGCVMWGFVRQWMHESNRLGLRLLDYDHLLYPQYGDDFKNTISQSQADLLRSEAAKMLEESPDAHPNVLAHWRMLADGGLPFGFTIGEDD